jgi:hypothetical protein
MTAYAVAQLDEIEEFADAGCHYRPIRHHLGITAFGVTAWTAGAAGDLVINEHAEGDPTADQELFLVLRGHAVLELDGDRVTRRPELSSSPLPTRSGWPPPRRMGRPSSRWKARRDRGTSPAAGNSGLRLPPLCGGRVRPGRRPTWRPGRSQSAVPHVVLQPRLLREPLRPDKSRVRSPPARRRDVGGVSPFREV